MQTKAGTRTPPCGRANLSKRLSTAVGRASPAGSARSGSLLAIAGEEDGVFQERGPLYCRLSGSGCQTQTLDGAFADDDRGRRGLGGPARGRSGDGDPQAAPGGPLLRNGRPARRRGWSLPRRRRPRDLGDGNHRSDTQAAEGAPDPRRPETRRGPPPTGLRHPGGYSGFQSAAGAISQGIGNPGRLLRQPDDLGMAKWANRGHRRAGGRDDLHSALRGADLSLRGSPGALRGQSGGRSGAPRRGAGALSPAARAAARPAHAGAAARQPHQRSASHPSGDGRRGAGAGARASGPPDRGAAGALHPGLGNLRRFRENRPATDARGGESSRGRRRERRGDRRFRHRRPGSSADGASSGGRLPDGSGQLSGCSTSAQSRVRLAGEPSPGQSRGSRAYPAGDVARADCGRGTPPLGTRRGARRADPGAPSASRNSRPQGGGESRGGGSRRPDSKLSNLYGAVPLDAMSVSMNRALVCIPTYNERDNIEAIARAALAADPRIDILVIDDNSPDGTGGIADELAATEPRAQVLHRPSKQGLGRAYLDGFRWALQRSYPFILEMDADFSHDPKYLPRFLDRAEAGVDLVLGSRYVPGGGTVNWGLGRKLVSRSGFASAISPAGSSVSAARY